MYLENLLHIKGLYKEDVFFNLSRDFLAVASCHVHSFTTASTDQSVTSHKSSC
jgi:hypothetical protein